MMARGLSVWRRGASVVVIAAGLLAVLTGCGESVEQLVAEAAALRATGDLPAAAIKLKAALAQDPKNIPARLLSARIYIDLGQGDAALGVLIRAQQDGAREEDIAWPRAEAALVARHYEDVIKDTDNPPDSLSNSVKASLLAYRGAASGALGHAADAEAALEQGLALDPHSLDVRVASARWALDRGDVDRAGREVAEAARETPKDPRIGPLQGDIAYAAGEYPKADQLFQKALDAEPWNDIVRSKLAAVQVAENKLPLAIATVDAVLKNPNLAGVPKQPILLYIRGLAAFRQNDYRVAQSNSEEVIKHVPDYEPARLIAGASSYALHEYERAYYYMSPYVAQNPKNIEARKLLAAIQLQLARPGDAAKTLSPATDNAAEDPDLLRLIGVAAARSGDVATADRYLKLALDRQPDDWSLRAELGVADIAAGDPKAGIDNLEQVLKAHPGVAEAEIQLFTALMQTKDYAKALGIAEQVIKSEPNSPTGELLAAVVYLAQGNVAAGRAALLKAHEIRPDDFSVNNNLAKLAMAEGKPDTARQFYQAILKADPHSAPTYVALAELDARTGRALEAEAVLLKGVHENPTDPALVAALLRLQLVRGEAQQAVAAGQQALKRFPRDPAVLHFLGRAELAAGQRDAALSTFTTLVNIAPDTAQAHTDLAEAYLSKDTPDSPQWSAINEATEAVRLDPKAVAAKLVLAHALITRDRFEEARKVVDELKTTDAKDLGVIELDGLVAQRQERWADAAAAFARAVALNDNARDRRGLADAELRLGHPDDAAKTLQGWLDAHPEDNQTRTIWADICVKDGRLAEAGKQYAEIVRRDPKNANAQNNLAWILSRLGQGEDALAHARAAVALAPESVDFLDTLGGILLRGGNSAEAVAALDKAWQKAPDRPKFGFHLAQALAAAGKKNEAAALLHQVLAGDRAFADRAQAQDLLRQVGG